MIVVIGQPVLDATGDVPAPTGTAARVALTAAARGSAVQLIGTVGEDPDGEALVLALARGGIGHVALLRDPTRRTPRLAGMRSDELTPDADDGDDAAPGILPAEASERPGLDVGDVELGLRYLTDFRVIVACEALDPATARVVGDAADWSTTALIAVVPPAAPEPVGLPAGAIVLQAPDSDPEGAFDRLVGELAAAIDSGTEPRTAFRDLLAGEGWESIGPEA